MQNLKQLCEQKISELNLDTRYSKRLEDELYEINAQGEENYFIELYENKVKFLDNENNLLIPYLLNIVDDFDIDNDCCWVQGEYPDVDVDFLPEVRSYLKNQWAADRYGQEYICSIGTYGTLGIKSAILDMAKIYGYDKNEIQAITVKMDDKDDDNNNLEWDKAEEIYPEFKDYCDRHPEVADAAKKLIDRNRSGGIHAGGLIISNVPIADFVPLELRSFKKEHPDGIIVSAWAEGQATQDLQAVGLIKLDFLVVNGLKQYGLGAHLIKQRHGLKSICAIPGGRDWSDISYLNDPKCIEMANNADLKGIFQFDSEGIRKIVKNGGVSRFDDLATYSSLYRPGPLSTHMHTAFCDRKQEREEYEIHPLIQSVLAPTYGVMAYQEQVMKILNLVGDIPLIHCESIRKAISKKKEKQFASYKEQFIQRGQINLSWTQEEVENLWGQIQAFAGYGFNKSVMFDTIIPTPNGSKKICNFQKGDKVYCINQDGTTSETEVLNLHDHGVLEAFEVEFDDGYKITCTLDHKFLTNKGQFPLWQIYQENLDILSNGENYAKKENRWLESKMWRGLSDKNENEQSSKRVSELPKTVFYYRELDGEMRESFSTEKNNAKTSTQLSRLPEFELEQENISSTLRSCISQTKGASQSFSQLQKMQSNKERKYQSEKSKNKSIGKSSENRFRDGEENLFSPGNSGTESRKSKKVERRKSRKICEMHRSGVEKSKKVSNGNLAQGATRMEGEKNQLWTKTKTGGFCPQKNMDRSRWILPFFRTSKQKRGKSISVANSSRKRQHVKERVLEKTDCNVNTNRYDLLCDKYRCNEVRMVDYFPNHASISNTRNLVPRKIVQIRSVGKKQMYDLEVANPTHNFLLPNGIATSNSHSYAYTYISARHIWLKAYYPLEFYCAVLMCEKDYAKIKEYKIDAKKHHVEIQGLHINNSKEDFSIAADEKIYYGFTKIKGIGSPIAKAIVEGQPYQSFEDFLERFGTEAKVVKPLIALGVFEEPYDRITLFKFYDHYKKHQKRRLDRQKRNIESLKNYQNQLEELLITYLPDITKFGEMNHFNEECEEKWKSLFGQMEIDEPYVYKGENRIRRVTVFKKIMDIVKKRLSCIQTFESRESIDDEKPPTLKDFNPFIVSIKKEDEELFSNSKQAESNYYGFAWKHPLEDSPSYTGLTFEDFDQSQSYKGSVEVLVLKSPKEKVSRKGTSYWSMEVEDSMNRKGYITIWSDDYERFKDDLTEGNMLRMILNPPFNNRYYSLDSPKKHLRNRVLPKNKEDDNRLYVMLKKENISKRVEAELQGFEII